MDAVEALRTRRSVRAFTMRPVPNEAIEVIVDCARLAPSAMNQQRWHFIAVTSREALTALAGCADAGGFLRDAGAAVAVVMEPSGPYLEDAACAAMAMMTAARELDLGSCWFHCHGKDHERPVAELLGVPEELRVVCVLGLGYGVLPPAPPKKSLGDVLRWERFADG